MASRTGASPDFWVTKKSSVTFWLLGILSFCSIFATTWGTFELIHASFSDGRSLADLTPLDFLIFGFAAAILFVVQLTLLWAVKLCYSRHASIMMRLIALVAYLTCLCITAGFGFGFWWKLFVSNAETLESTRAAVEMAGSELNRAAGRLDGLKLSLDSLKVYSTRRANEEATRGNTCGASQGIPGPRQRLRNNDAAKFDTLAVYITKQLGAVRSNIDSFQALFGKIIGNDSSVVDRSGSKTASIENLSYQLSLAINSFNDLGTDPILQSAKKDLEHRAVQTEFVEGAIKFSCPDSELSAQLNGIIAAIDGLSKSKLEFQKITITQGPKAVAYALNRLKNTATVLIFECHLINLASCNLPPSSAEIREHLGAGAGNEVREDQAGLGRDDVLPLAFGVIVDILILLFGYFRFRGTQVAVNTREFIARVDNCFKQVFDRLPTASERLLPIKAAVFDRWSGYYAAVPVDFRDYTSVRSNVRRVPRWARQSEDQPDSAEVIDEERSPTIHEAQYLDNVFTAFNQAGFVRLLGFWGKLSNFLSERAARKYLDRRNSFFANAPSLKLYKFYPDGYATIMEHFFSSESNDGGSDSYDGNPSNRSRPDTQWSKRTRTSDHFPKGFDHEV